MSKKALIVWGGWEGHQPQAVAGILEKALKENGFEVEVSNTLDACNDGAKLKQLSLIVPCWTMGKIGGEQCKNVCQAVESGVGLGGCHGGMCDAFRENTEWQFLTGGQFVAHPGGAVKHRVHIKGRHWITKDIKNFDFTSEQYYMHVDPANKVLATTEFPVADGPHVPNGKVQMPVTWTRMWGKGRVAYCSLGHDAKSFDVPECLRMCVRCLLWAAHADETAG
ncbi:MAG: ThuA domain-containing protein [Planctomycetota bacterium]|nr:ThuA domain-containing protein [Planctomycetota bacterium]